MCPSILGPKAGARRGLVERSTIFGTRCVALRWVVRGTELLGRTSRTSFDRKEMLCECSWSKWLGVEPLTAYSQAISSCKSLMQVTSTSRSTSAFMRVVGVIAEPNQYIDHVISLPG
jgi:hypothetical protein